MKIGMCALFCLSLVGLGPIALTGCDDNDGGNRQLTTEERLQVSDILEQLEMEAGISLPEGAELINYGDGGGRDSSYEFYQWVVFSPTSINISTNQLNDAKGPFVLPMGDTVDLFQSRMKGERINGLQSAWFIRWRSSGYQFTGTVIRSLNGDYLAIERTKAD